MQFLRKLRAKLGRRPIALFMDQLPVHKSVDIRPEYARLDITPVYNVGYSPELNPIEAVFSKVKAVFSRARLNNLVNNIHLLILQLVPFQQKELNQLHII